MSNLVFGVLLAGSILAAVGQLFLKLGVSNEPLSLAWINLKVMIGISCYIIGMLFWMYGLSKAPLSLVYPFTMLTFILVGILSVIILGEHVAALVYIGWIVILLGLAIIQYSSKT